MSHPIAPTPEAALHGPLGRAARENEARALAGAEVAFETAVVGPAFTTREAAEAAYAPRLDDPAFSLRPVLADGATASPPLRPAMKDGARWPAPAASSAALWRLQVAFWRVLTPQDEAEIAPLDSARTLRRDPASAQGLDARALRRLAAQPLQPVRPQQPLDIGLFERRLPEAPGQLIPDE